MKVYAYFIGDGWYYSDRNSQLKGPYPTRNDAEQAAAHQKEQPK